MNRQFLFALAAALAVTGSGFRPAAAAPPSILIVSVDTLRADHLGSYGYRRETSPNIDALLARGARFSQARTVEPLTAPALASMLTSLDPHEHAATRNGLRMRSDLLSFPKIFKRRGWETAAFVGNWTLQDKISGLGEHFGEYNEILDSPRWFGFYKGEATAEDLTARALEWLESRAGADSDQPFLLWVHYVEPHAPYVLQKDFAHQVGARSGPDKVFRYDTEIAFVDHHVGTLLREIGILVPPEDLITVFVSDHGESFGEHDYWGHGRHLYEPCLHVPMGIVWPGSIEPTVISQPALITDIAPSLLGLSGLVTPDFYSGYDWSAVLRGEGEAPERVTYYQAHKGAVQRRDAPQHVRQRGLLELARIEGTKKETVRMNGKRRLFDLEIDPRETHPLEPLDRPASTELQDWFRRVRVGLVRSDELPPPALDDADLEALRALGYID